MQLLRKSYNLDDPNKAQEMFERLGQRKGTFARTTDGNAIYLTHGQPGDKVLAPDGQWVTRAQLQEIIAEQENLVDEVVEIVACHPGREGVGEVGISAAPGPSGGSILYANELPEGGLEPVGDVSDLNIELHDSESIERSKVAQRTTEEIVERPPVPERSVPGEKISEELAEEALERPIREGAKEAVEEIAEEVAEDVARASTERATICATAEGIEEIAQHTRIGRGIVIGGAALAAGTVYLLSQRRNRKRRRRDGISLESQASQMHYYS
jgi:hypothetical protein